MLQFKRSVSDDRRVGELAYFAFENIIIPRSIKGGMCFTMVS